MFGFNLFEQYKMCTFTKQNCHGNGTYIYNSTNGLEHFQLNLSMYVTSKLIYFKASNVVRNDVA